MGNPCIARGIQTRLDFGAPRVAAILQDALEPVTNPGKVQKATYLYHMATTSDIKNGLCLRHQGGLYQVLEFLHKKTARGSGNVWTKMKNLENQ